MTTNLIQSTSSAPTLREWAMAEWQRKVAEYDARERGDRTTGFKRRVDALRIYLRDKIGLSDDESIQIVATSDVSSGFITTTADGLRFTLKDLPYADSGRDRERLHVSVECSRGCGKDLWVNVESLDDLGAVLQPDATNTHEFGCLQKFGDYGEPITDGMGNPLPPPKPPQPSALERSRLAIQAIGEAGDDLAAALNTVTALEDERTLVKIEAIKRLMEAGAATSVTAAEKIVEKDDGYMAHRAQQRTAELGRQRALAAYDAATLSARLAVEIFIAEERNR